MLKLKIVSFTVAIVLLFTSAGYGAHLRVPIMERGVERAREVASKSKIPSSVKELFENAEVLVNNGKTIEALRKYKEIMEKFGDVRGVMRRVREKIKKLLEVELRNFLSLKYAPQKEDVILLRGATIAQFRKLIDLFLKEDELRQDRWNRNDFRSDYTPGLKRRIEFILRRHEVNIEPVKFIMMGKPKEDSLGEKSQRDDEIHDAIENTYTDLVRLGYIDEGIDVNWLERTICEVIYPIRWIPVDSAFRALMILIANSGTEIFLEMRSGPLFRKKIIELFARYYDVAEKSRLIKLIPPEAALFILRNKIQGITSDRLRNFFNPIIGKEIDWGTIVRFYIAITKKKERSLFEKEIFNWFTIEGFRRSFLDAEFRKQISREKDIDYWEFAGRHYAIFLILLSHPANFEAQFQKALDAQRGDAQAAMKAVIKAPQGGWPNEGLENSFSQVRRLEVWGSI